MVAVKEQPEIARASVLEVPLVVCALILLIVGQLYCGTGGSLLLARPLWFDECLTAYLSRDPHVGHSLHALASGVETNPPTLFLLMRGWFLIAGDGVVSMRAFSLVCVIAALVIYWVIMRRVLGRLLASVALLLVWAQPVVMQQAFEARFYAPMLLAIALLALGLTNEKTKANAALLAIASIFLCTIHYFGIIVFLLMVVGYALVRGVNGLLPTILGPLAFIPCVLLLVRQRANLSIATWIEPVTAHSIAKFLNDLVPFYLLLFLVIAIVCFFWGRSFSSSLVPSVSLLLMPVVVLIISLLVQPVLMDRYAIAFAFGLATFIAASFQKFPGPLLWLLCIGLMLLQIANLNDLSMRQRDSTFRLSQIVLDITEQPSQPVLAEDALDLFPLLEFHSELAGKLDLLQPTPTASARIRFDAEMAKHVTAFYPVAKMVNAQQAPPQFLLVVAPQAMDIPSQLPADLSAHFTAKSLDPVGWVFQMTRKP